MKRLVSGIVLGIVHFASRLFFRVEVKWIGESSRDPWQRLRHADVRLIALLNHTSLFEPLFAAGVPLHFLWFMAGRLLVPGADKTLDRPVAGRFFKLLAPAMVPISRKRDGTWEKFLSFITPQTIVMLAPEGRMKRRGGLDSKGEPMSVRGGIADILQAIPTGTMILCYSGGLHHIQAPGDAFPKLFQKARICFEAIDIAGYKAQMANNPDLPFKMAVVKDLEARTRVNCPA